MTHGKRLAAASLFAAALSLAGCKGGANDNSANGSAASPGKAATPVSTASGETGVEKVKPAPGTGNVQGKVLYNGQPVEGIKVNLCEQFNQYFGDPCGGKKYEARTDKDGDYVVTNVEPKVYKGLLVWVFDTDSYVFATSSYGISANSYEVAADKTLFVRPTNLFKSDLKLVSPKAAAKVSAQGLELKWEPYPNAAYYKFSLYPEEASVTSPYIKERVDGTSFAVAKPVPSGTYRFEVEAFNGADQKLAEGPDDYKFTVTDTTAQ